MSNRTTLAGPKSTGRVLMLSHTIATLVVATSILLLITPAPVRGVGPSAARTISDYDLTTYFDANDLLMFVTNTGSFAYDQTALLGKSDGLHFPNGDERTVMYASGLWIGAMVDGEVRVTISEYSDEYVPGPMLGGTFQPDNPSFRVYKINAGDTPFTNTDYAEWPYDQGAPVMKDFFGNDSLDADGFRIPVLRGDQALWTVFNDANPTAHYNDAGSTLPLGVEVQLYAYGDGETCPTGRTINMCYRIINKGGNDLEETYVSFWADPDIGFAGDDLVGCDPERSLGFAYNDSSDAIYGHTVPSVGFGILQGPIVPFPGDSAWRESTGECLYGYANLPMTSFNKYINGTDPGTPQQAYNYMQGLTREGATLYDPSTGLPTKFACPGDPVAGTGWVDETAGDRRYMVTTGPFDMAPDDTQEVVIAVFVGNGMPIDGFAGDTVFADHVAGSSDGSAFAVIIDPASTNGHDYQIGFEESASSLYGYSWLLRDLTGGFDVFTGLNNQSGDDDYPILDGMVVKLLGPRPGVGDWDIPNGERRFTWSNADGFGWEGFNGAIGWGGPGDTHGFGVHDPVHPSMLPRVLLKLAESDADGNFNYADPNVSSGYRYLRGCCDPAQPEFEPYILDPSASSYGFQEFTPNVPLSAWNVDVDPPQRLTVGFIENNVIDGLVDGKYWPSDGSLNNTAGDGPREWLWVYLDDYSETVKPEFTGNAIDDPMPIMYWLTVNRRGAVPFEPGDEFLIIPGSGFNTDADVFEFTAPDPILPFADDPEACWPAYGYHSITELRLTDSIAASAFGCGRGSPPVAIDDDKSARDGATLYVVGAGVLTNDFDADGDPLTAVLDSDVSHGTLTMMSNGSFFYTPDSGFDGIDQFTYFADDGQYLSDSPATVSLHVRSGGAIAPGDYDEDGEITSLDIAGLIDAVFANGPDPTDGGCRVLPRGDVDCDGFSTSLDLARLIDYVFAGGAGPCDPCMQ